MFCAVAFLPAVSPPYAVRCGLGLLLWMGMWWLTRPVHLAVTGLLPLVVVSLFGFVPIADVLPSYADELIILLIGANRQLSVDPPVGRIPDRVIATARQLLRIAIALRGRAGLLPQASPGWPGW
jgi:hypothetical protein